MCLPDSHVAIISQRHLLILTVQPKSVNTGANGDLLRQVPPASRGNRAGARLSSPREAGGTCRLKGVGFCLARLAWRAGRPRSQRRACWERERLARMATEMPCSATPRAGTPAKNLPPKGNSLPAGGESWGGGYVSHCKDTHYPTFRAGGNTWDEESTQFSERYRRHRATPPRFPHHRREEAHSPLP